MKHLFCLLPAALFSYQISFSQSAGNVVYNPGGYNNQNLSNNRYGGGPQMIAYNPPPGVNLNAGAHQSREQLIKSDIMINIKATSYTAIFSLTQNADRMMQTDSLSNIRIENMIAAIRKDPAIKFEYHVDFIALVPRYKTVTEEKRFSKTVNEVPDGFEMKKNIHVLFYNHDHLATIIAAAGKGEIYECVKVEYNVKDMDAVYEQLRIKAKEVLDAKYVKRTNLGFKLEMLSMGETQGSVYPIERYAQYQAFKNGTPEYVVIESRKKQDKDKPQPVTYTGIEKTPTIYYERIPYNQFDAVLNADVAEPCVQFYYSLQVNYRILIDAEEQIKKEDRALTVEMKKAEIKQINTPAPLNKTK
ncbi:MAG: hypothetical protein ACHQF2_08205 [Flavobacteriales bacterium]